DGRSVAVAGGVAASPRVVIFDVRTGQEVKQIVAPGNREGGVGSLALSPDGTKLLWGEYDGQVALWDLPGNRLLFRERLREDEANEVVFSPDGSLIAIGGDEVVRLRRVAKPAEVVRDLSTRPRPAAGQLEAPKVVRTVMGRQGIGCLAFTPDGTRLV